MNSIVTPTFAAMQVTRYLARFQVKRAKPRLCDGDAPPTARIVSVPFTAHYGAVDPDITCRQMAAIGLMLARKLRRSGIRRIYELPLPLSPVVGFGSARVRSPKDGIALRIISDYDPIRGDVSRIDVLGAR